MRIFLGATLIAFLMTAPASAGPIEKYYKSIPLTPADKEKILPLDGPPEMVRSSGNLQADLLDMYSRGYGLVGETSFEWKLAKEKSFLKHARKVGARYVVISSEFFRTDSGAVPLTLPNTTTSYTNGTVRAGSAWGSYTGTTTTNGTNTTYIPYSQDRYTQTAGFFVPLKRVGFGILFDNLTRDQVAELGSNKGAFVRAVRRGSPAFRADILPGDVVKVWNGVEVVTAEDLSEAIPSAFGKAVEIAVVRKGVPLKLLASLPPNGAW